MDTLKSAEELLKSIIEEENLYNHTRRFISYADTMLNKLRSHIEKGDYLSIYITINDLADRVRAFDEKNQREMRLKTLSHMLESLIKEKSPKSSPESE